MQPDLTPVFGRFAGREVGIFETKRRVDIGDRDVTVTDHSLVPGDTTVKELKEEAARHDLRLQLWLGDTIPAADVNPKRLHVHVRQESDGKYRIGDDITLEGGGVLTDVFAPIVARGVDADISVMKPLQLALHKKVL